MREELLMVGPVTPPKPVTNEQLPTQDVKSRLEVKSHAAIVLMVLTNVGKGVEAAEPEDVDDAVLV